MKITALVLAALFSGSVKAELNGPSSDILVKVDPTLKESTWMALQARFPEGSVIEDLDVEGWVRVHVAPSNFHFSSLNAMTLAELPGVLSSQPNSLITLNAPWQIRDARVLKKINPRAIPGLNDVPPADNPPLPVNGSGGSGPDPLAPQQWGMRQMGVSRAWTSSKGRSELVVAIIDTGVDYTHEDLVDNLWRNPGETGTDARGQDKSKNGVDDDLNGYVDDVIGWDFVDNDNKPFDFTGSLLEILTAGANPGHGTHCAGSIAARAGNGKGIAGVAPGVRIMPLRFIGQKGGGNSANVVKAIRYAVMNGARVISSSWGSEGEDGKNAAANTALQDAIKFARDRGVLFIAAAGNGRLGKGYDNDSDPKPAIPASYDIENIISVAAVDEAGHLGSFSNWGAKTVHLAAPGVKIFSTVTQSARYSDTLVDIPGLLTAHWDGTSMATPYVAGAAALYMSQHPEKDWRAVKAAILGSVKRTAELNGKTLSGGQLDVLALSQF